MLLTYDTETTGMVLFNERSHHPGQPHIVELAAVLVDGDAEVAVLHTLIKPDGWVIPPEAVAIHGITTERALAEGRPEAEVVREFMSLVGRCDERLAYNEYFDMRVLSAALYRAGYDEPEREAWKTTPARRCPMARLTDMCRLPHAPGTRARGRYKWPSLIEAYRHLFGEELAGAHGAMADCRAVLAVWRKLQEMDAASAQRITTGEQA